MKSLVEKLILVLVVSIALQGVIVYSVNAESNNFVAHLSGGGEIPVATDTRAQGQAIFKLNEDGTELYFKLIVSNIENLRMAHIHLAPADQNGPIVVWLYPDAPPGLLIPGRFNGVLAEGTLTSADLVGPLNGQTLDDLIEKIRLGNTYVNVHTVQYPPGEIRGQIKLKYIYELFPPGPSK